jgi:exodeoxyribonuclease V alpha subunit
LYLHRYWEYESHLAADIARRVGTETGPWDEALLRDGLRRLFPPTGDPETDWQKVAAFVAMRKNFCVIAGGPGTGKTHTLVLILALLLEQVAGRNLRIAVTAPTGKAAARIQESIRQAKAGLPCAADIKARLPDQAATLHRLLGGVPGSAYFRHDAGHPLPVDIVVVDEASMVDLALMAKLFQALPPPAKVILLGDKDQLASVEAGAVLGEICAAAEINTFSDRFARDYANVTGEKPDFCPPASDASPLTDCVVELKRSFRFGTGSGIGRLARAINAGNAGGARDILHEAREGTPDLAWAALPAARGLKAALAARLIAAFEPFLRANDARTALDELRRFRVLCAVREGPFGVARVNELAEEILAEAGLVRPDGPWYAHRPILITRNDHGLQLFNGDTGVILPDPESGEPRAFFPGPDERVRQFPPARLPPHETVYAMTVHKSQGSEFDRVLFVLPERESPVLTRELLYTGLTRARQHAELWGDEDVFAAAVARRVSRSSGLRDALRGRRGPETVARAAAAKR